MKKEQTAKKIPFTSEFVTLKCKTCGDEKTERKKFVKISRCRTCNTKL